MPEQEACGAKDENRPGAEVDGVADARERADQRKQKARFFFAAVAGEFKQREKKQAEHCEQQDVVVDVAGIRKRD